MGKFKILQGGTVEAQIKMPQQLLNGKHVVKMIQQIDGKNIQATESFVKLPIEDSIKK